MGLFGGSDDKKRQPAGSANGGQFAPDTSGKTPPASDPLDINRYTPNGGAMGHSTVGVDAAHAAFQATQSEEERLIALTDEELHDRALTALRRGDQVFAAEMVELKRIAKLKADHVFNSKVNMEDDTNTWREYRLPMNDMDFTGVKLQGVDFGGADLKNAKFNETVLKDCKFSGAILTGSSFNGSTLQDVDFYGASLAKSDFSNVAGDNVSFERAGLSDAKFHGAALRFSDFRSANLYGALMESVTLTGSNLEGARMRSARIVPVRYADTNGAPNWG